MTGNVVALQRTHHTGSRAGISVKGNWIINNLLLLWFCCGELLADKKIRESVGSPWTTSQGSAGRTPALPR